MIDLSKEIIEIARPKVKPGTTLEGMKSFFGDKVHILKLCTGLLIIQKMINNYLDKKVYDGSRSV